MTKDEKAAPSTESVADNTRQPTDPAVQSEMMAFMGAPVLTHRERRTGAAAGKKAPPKHSS